MKQIIRVLNVLYKVLFAAIIAMIVIVGLTLLPLPGNYRIYTVVSGSMEPALPVGSIVFVKPQSDYFVGDIVTIRTDDPKATITHRITAKTTAGSETSFETKGDANQSNDPDIRPLQQIIGKVRFNLPLIGYPITFSKTLEGLIILIIIPATIVIYSEIINIKNEVVKIVQKRPK